MTAECHAIETNGDLAAFVAARQPAWHRLGDYEADRLLTLPEATERAHLFGWDVRHVPALADLGALGTAPIEGKVAVIRDNPWTDGQVDVLGIVGEGCRIWQNEQTAEFAQQIMGLFGDEEVVSAAGSIQGGTRVFYTLALEGFTVLGSDAHDQWLSVMSSHDGSLALTAVAGATRVVCRNTFNAAVHGIDPKVKVRHSGDMHVKVSEAAHALEVARNWQAAYTDLAEHLATERMTANAFDKMIQANFLLPERKDEGIRTTQRRERDREFLMATFTTSPTTETGRGTRWAALNAVTEWAEWGRPGDLTTETQAVANLFSTPADIRQKAVKVLAKV